MYRTICSLFVLLAIVKLYESYLADLTFFKEYGVGILIVLILALFIFSYRKQTTYITKRVESNQPTA